MNIKKLEPTDWQAYFDKFSKNMSTEHRTDYAEIRILSEEIGSQKETSWLPLKGLTYDSRSEILEVLVENMDHMVLEPSEIYVDENEAGTINALEVIRRDGIKEIIEVR